MYPSQIFSFNSLRCCYYLFWGFSGVSVVKNLPAKQETLSSFPGSGRSPGPAPPRLLTSPRSAAPPPDSRHHHHQSLRYLIISSQNCCKTSSFAFLSLSVAPHQHDVIHRLPVISVKCKTGHVTDSSACYYLQDKSLTPRFFLI